MHRGSLVHKGRLFIHLGNLLILLLSGMMVVCAAVIRPYQLMVGVLPPLLMWGYWVRRTSRHMVWCCWGLACALLLYIVLCEHVVTIDNLFGSEITRKLTLGVQQLTYAAEHLHINDSHKFQACCDDPWTYHYHPGAPYHCTFDCATCNKPYTSVVDETGYLNLHRGLMDRSAQIDMFLSGDSVTQGLGLPGLLTFVREQLPMTMWDLSIAGYSPRQKINALLTYALPKKPRWIIVEFYSVNDAIEAVKDAACVGSRHMLCLHHPPEVRLRVATHPRYGPWLEVADEGRPFFNALVRQSFTLAVTHYLTDQVKGRIKAGVLSWTPYTKESFTARNQRIHQFESIAYPAGLGVAPEHIAAWVHDGMAITHTHYQRLVERLEQQHQEAAVILLYNPSAYEIYQNILLDNDPRHDQLAAIQVDALRTFADQQGWIFLDLTLPLRQGLQGSPWWIFGHYDGSHWSQQGTAFVATVLTAELVKIINRGWPPRLHAGGRTP